jgi:hypothetical protein
MNGRASFKSGMEALHSGTAHLTNGAYRTPNGLRMQHVDRYVPANTNGGWGFATFIVLLAVACIATATFVHKRTYKHPTDVTWHGRGEPDHGR